MSESSDGVATSTRYVHLQNGLDRAKRLNSLNEWNRTALEPPLGSERMPLEIERVSCFADRDTSMFREFSKHVARDGRRKVEIRYQLSA
jgi:hypothetical protein